jgi:hypothetical protein
MGFGLASVFGAVELCTASRSQPHRDFVFLTLKKPSLLIRSLTTNAASRGHQGKDRASASAKALGPITTVSVRKTFGNVTAQSWAQAKPNYAVIETRGICFATCTVAHDLALARILAAAC